MTALLLAAVALAGCAEPPHRIRVDRERSFDALPTTPTNPLPRALAVDPDTGAIDVAYETWDGIALVPLPRAGPAPFTPRWSGEAPSATLVALGGGLYAVLGGDGGLLLDESTGASRPLFCLLPGADEGRWPPELDQRSLALAYDPASERLWAQPRTFRGREAVQSAIAAFDAETGEELGWWTLEDASFEAGAMAVLPDGWLVLADWRAIHVFDPRTGALREVSTLRELGLVSVLAMAWDPVDGRVLAIDSPPARLVLLDVRRG